MSSSSQMEQSDSFIKNEQQQFNVIQEQSQTILNSFIETTSKLYEGITSYDSMRLNDIMNKLEELERLREDVDIKSKKMGRT
ncbi:hypothetical protein QTN25_001355 [Entamoeba marina]